MSITEPGRNERPIHPHIDEVTPELAAQMQDAGMFSKPTRWTVMFAEHIRTIAEWDGHNNTELMERAA